MKNLPKINPAKAVKASLPYLIAGLLCTKLGECMGNGLWILSSTR